MKTLKYVASLGVSALALGACSAEPEGHESAQGVEQALVCPDVANTRVDRSLAIVDPAVLAKFSFQRTLNRIRTTANVGASTTSVGLYQQLMRTFGSTPSPGDCNDASIDPSGFGITCPRPDELSLATVNPLAANATVKFNPVAVMNRFDLTPSNGATCGEYRIVYAMNSTNPTISGRAFIIFEASLPNPNPASGLEGCLPVAQFWQGLTANADVNLRASKLEKFFFLGGAVPGFPAVVNAANYGLANAGATRLPGQVRTNFFVNFNEWHLREFKTRRTCTNASDPATCALTFQHVTVKENPANEVFGSGHALSADFATSFVNQTAQLAASDVDLIKMKIDNKFNEFESVSQRTDVLYSAPGVTSASLRTSIRQKLTSIGSSLTVNNILDRATTQTCAGCHLLSDNADLGGGLTWPSAAGFVHIDEQSNLSFALTSSFLPHRKQVLETFINNLCDGAAPAVAAGFTVGGSPEGAAN